MKLSLSAQLMLLLGGGLIVYEAPALWVRLMQPVSEPDVSTEIVSLGVQARDLHETLTQLESTMGGLEYDVVGATAASEEAVVQSAALRWEFELYNGTGRAAMVQILVDGQSRWVERRLLSGVWRRAGPMNSLPEQVVELIGKFETTGGWSPEFEVRLEPTEKRPSRFRLTQEGWQLGGV